MIYFNIYFLVLTLVLFSFLIHSQKVKIYLYLLTIFFISILSAIRWKTGTDWDSYYELFSFGGNLSEYMNYYHFEYFFKFINFLGNKIIGNYNVYLFIITFLTLLLKTIVIVKRPYILIVFLVLFSGSLLDLFPTRQSISCSIVILSIYFYSKNKYLKFIILLCISTMIHISSIVILLVIVIDKLSLFKIFLIALFSSLLIYLFLYNGNLISILTIIKPNVIEQYNLYITSSININYIALIYKISIFFIIFKIFPFVQNKLIEFEILSIKLFMFGLIVNIIIPILLPNVFIRLTLPFISFEFIVLASLVYYSIKYIINNHFSKLVVLILFFIYCLVRFYGSFSNYSDLYYPYETIFDSTFKEIR